MAQLTTLADSGILIPVSGSIVLGSTPDGGQMSKLLLVLGTLLASGSRGYVSLQDLAREVGLPPSTVHRILQLCVAHGMVIQSRDQRYSVGPSLLALGMSAAEEWGLRTAAHGALQGLAAPVRGPWGHVLASVSTLTPASLIQGERRQELIDAVRMAAHTISDRLRLPPDMRAEGSQ